MTGFIRVSKLDDPSSPYYETTLTAILRADKSWFEPNEQLDQQRQALGYRRGFGRVQYMLNLSKKGIASIKRAIPSFNERDYDWDFLSAGGFEDERRKIQADIARLQRMLNLSSQRF